MITRSLPPLVLTIAAATAIVACSGAPDTSVTTDEGDAGPQTSSDSGGPRPTGDASVGPTNDAGGGPIDNGDDTFGGRVSDNPAVQVDANGRHKSWRDGLARVPGTGDKWWMPASTVPYPKGQVHSPITRAIAHHLRQIVLAGDGLNDATFVKVGDSISTEPVFMVCMQGAIDGAINPSKALPAVVWGTHETLKSASVHYRSVLVDPNGQQNFAEGSSFVRKSAAALGGTRVAWAVTGNPTPIQTELDAIKPQFAVVMFGTNDAGYGDVSEQYKTDLAKLLDYILSRATIPILSTIPYRNDGPTDARIDAYNDAIRAAAELRQIPLVDLNMVLKPLANRGLRDDKLHPSYDTKNFWGVCKFDAAGLAYGYNTRNLVTVEALDRVMKVCVDGKTALD
jgi:hypothetical protein